jgi:translation initiation factor IF-2
MPVLTRRAGTEGEVRLIQMKPPIIVRDLATVLGVKPFKLINEVTQATGGFASMNSSLDEAVAAKIAENHGFILEVKHRGEAVAQTPQDKEVAKRAKAEEDEAKNLAPRPPVVCILGHVDHGKTSLLDAIRKAAVAAGEAGGITQHIGAYQIEHNGKKITFLDTPGHAAFNKMRARGAAVTDIAVLVVAADDGFMPQTDEALQHARTAGVALMVAVNKMDVKGANLDRVKQQMQERNIAPEDWGGETITVPVSALKGAGLTDLLDMILLQADVLELKANPKTAASGVVIESQVDVGRGPLATVIVQRGTLRVGDALVCGPHWCKVRALYDDKGAAAKEAPPATPVRIIGWSGTPDAGAPFTTARNAREAEQLAEAEQQTQRRDAATAIAAVPQDVSVEQLFANIAAEQKKTLKVIVKTDVFGSAEAVRQLLEGIKSAKVSLEVLSAEVGLVTKNDVLMAGTGGAVIIGFNTKLENGVTPLAKHHGVRIESFTIIYELADKVREMMADLLDPDLKETKTGAAEVRATFPQGKGFVAGCLVTEGRIARNSLARLRRKKEIVHEGKIATLKRFKDDANEVRAGLECGIKLGDFNAYEPGDVIECYEVQKVRAAL